LIKLEHVTKRYGAARGVEDITFDVSEGEILGFLGPNGAGKTTTLRVITGYHPATSGTVTVNGYDVFEQAQEAKRHIGYLPEIPPLYHDSTVKEQLEFVARVKQVPVSQRKEHLDRIAQRVGITEVFHRLIRNLSKGYRQRVGLAQALVGDPPVLILDEPTIGLDPRQIIEIRQLLRDLKDEHTVIISSHILPEISQLCERVVIINGGRMVAVDTPAALSRRLRQGQRVLVRIDGPPTEIVAKLHDIPGVAEVAVAPQTDQLGRLYEVQVEKEADIRRDLSMTMAESGWPILELKSHDMSLEDVFLELVTEEDIGLDASWQSSETDTKPEGVNGGA
jgi:ABC-2 type transport system ATP-binding protein